MDDLLFAPELRYLDEISPGLRPTPASSSIQAQRAINAGGGIGVLPCFLAQGLVRVLPELPVIERRFWLSTHRDVHATARMRVVRDWLVDLAVASRAALSPYPRGPAESAPA